METNNTNNKQPGVINLKDIVQTLWAKKKSFVLPLSIVFVISCIYIFSQPRHYATDARLAPEMESTLGAGGTLGSIASSFGIDLGEMQTSDAITPLLYPDLMDDNAFVCKLFNIMVQTQDGKLKTTYYDYLTKHQKSPWWSGITSFFSDLLKSKDEEGAPSDSTQFNPYVLTRQQNDVVSAIQGNIGISMDKKTGVISIDVKDQDPLICKTLADSVITFLQEFIIDYRTNKARTDVIYYTSLVDSLRQEYEKAYLEHARFADANQHTVLEVNRNKLGALENEMQLKYTSYSMMTAQLQAAQGKVQERTPAFTVLKGAAVPLKPAGPKRVRFIIFMLILASLGVSARILLKN
ncbi:MAG: chain-length determining protein [Prevotella sp.]|nr:chain-length determining protein [Prevotella sp.]